MLGSKSTSFTSTEIFALAGVVLLCMGTFPFFFYVSCLVYGYFPLPYVVHNGYFNVTWQVMINSSVLPALRHLLSSSRENLQKEACWAISNITAGNRVQIQVCTLNYVISWDSVSNVSFLLHT